MVDARTESTLSLKMWQNHLLCEHQSRHSQAYSARFEVSATVVVLPWNVAISLRQNVEFFSSYNSFILLNSADHAR